MNTSWKIFERLICHRHLAKQLGRHDSEFPNRLYSSKSRFKDGKTSTPLSFINLKSHIPVLLKNAGEMLPYEETSSGQIIVYTDGSCLCNNKVEVGVRKSGIGVYWGNDNHSYNLSIPHGGNRLSSNRAEIASAHAAILIARFAKIKNLCLRTDSKIVVDTFTSWLPQWKATHWVSKATGRPIKNQDMLKKVSDELKFVTVEFQHHSDKVEGIKKAHVLAQKGANLS